MFKAFRLPACLQFDAAQTNDGQDEDATREYVAQLVTRQMGLEGFALDPRQVGWSGSEEGG
jgi:hypothetical protein